MLTKTRIKWGVSIILAGILLALALVGGNWGTTYAADIEDNPVPTINFISPNRIQAGSPSTLLFISGTNFDIKDYTGVRIVGNGIERILTDGLIIPPNSIWINIPSDLLVNPTIYEVTVVVSYGDPRSIPTIPITPWDEESNPKSLLVYEGSYLPIIFK